MSKSKYMKTCLFAFSGLFIVMVVAEMAGAAGVAIGLIDVFAWVGVAAALGLLALMIAAIGAHVQADDQLHELVPAAALASVAVAYLAVVAVG